MKAPLFILKKSISEGVIILSVHKRLFSFITAFCFAVSIFAGITPLTARAAAGDSVTIKFLGHAAFQLSDGTTTVISDPSAQYADLNGLTPSAVTVSHDYHGDHWYWPDIPQGTAILHGAPDFATFSSIDQSVSGFEIKDFKTYHMWKDSFFVNPDGPSWDNAAFLYTVNGLKVLHSGDMEGTVKAFSESQVDPEIQAQVDAIRDAGVDVLILNVASGSGTIHTPAEMQKFIDYIHPKIVIPMHLGIPGADGYLKDFLDGTSYPKVGKNGSTVTISTSTLPAETTIWVLESAYAPPAGWQKLGNDFSAQGDVDDDISMKISNGIPYVAYVDAGNDDKVTVKKWDGISWTGVGGTGNDGVVSEGEGGDVSLFLYSYTSFGITMTVPYVAYSDGGKVTVKKLLDDYTWGTVGSAGFSADKAQEISLFVYDNNGTPIPYVSYMDYTVLGIFIDSSFAAVKKFDYSLGWTGIEQSGSEQVSQGRADDSTSLYVYQGTPYVAYVDTQNNNLGTVKKWDGNSWVGVGGTGNDGVISENATSINLTVDGSGVPYVVYRDGENGYKATVRKFADNSWQTVGSPGFSLGDLYGPSLFVDGTTPYVAFCDVTNDYKSTVMKYNGVSWETIGTSDFSEGSLYKPSLAVYDGMPYIAYDNETDSGDRGAVSRYLTPSEECAVKNVVSPSGATLTDTSEIKTIAAAAGGGITAQPVSVLVSPGATWKLYSDSGCTSEISDKTMTLAPGTNTSYIRVTAQDGSTSQIYTLTITAEDVTPAITGLSPSSGPEAGGTQVTITGTGLSVVDAVYFGATSAASFSLGTDLSMTAVSPPGSDSVAVSVYSGDEQSNTLTYTYVNSPITIPVTGVSVTPASVSLRPGETRQLTAIVSPTDAANKNVTWSSSNGTIASVSNGVITANSAGNATITATTLDGGYSANCTVSVEQRNTGGGGGSTTPVETPPTLTVDSKGRVSITATPKLDNSTVTAEIEVSTTILTSAFDKAIANSDGVKAVAVEIPKVGGAKAYELTLPARSLTAGDASKAVEIKTGIANVTLPGNMLSAANIAGVQNVSVTIAVGDKNKLDTAVQAQIGDRPVIELDLKINGKQTAWSNESAPVTVTIPYTPMAEELKDPEHITVWYIDGSGKAVFVPSGRYDPATGKVTLSTTHFSKYAVAFVEKTFADINMYGWAKKQIEVLASKGIINGTSNDTFSPAASITRADYLVLLIKTLGLTAKFDSNFEDVEPGTYYYEAAGIAKKLGITEGSGNNRFNPKGNISRQDMMVLTTRALEKLKKFKITGSSTALDNFKDKADIAVYAVESLAALVKEGLISGSGDMVNPRAQTTRAEAAVFLYRIYNKY